MRLIFLLIVLVAVVLIPFFIWGDTLMAFFSWEHSLEWLRGYGTWAWAIAIILLIADLFLPLPATIIMSALGYIYGPMVGGLISAAGSFASGVLAYWLCRMLGENAATWVLGKKEYERGNIVHGELAVLQPDHLLVRFYILVEKCGCLKPPHNRDISIVVLV